MKINKIIIIQPPLECNEKHKKIMPLGIGYLLAVLKKQFTESNIIFIDVQSSNISKKQVINKIKYFEPDILMFSYWTPMANYVYDLIDDIKPIISNNCQIISGGVHPSIFPEEALKKSNFVVKYEGENTILELLNALKNNNDFKKIKGLYYKENNKIIYTGDRDFIKNLDSIPFPEWDLMPMENYTTAMHVTGGNRIPVMGSRGCPYACSYCVSPFIWKRKLRWRKPEKVVDEIEIILKKYKIDKIHFWDDNLFMNREYVTSLCNEIINRKLKIIWVGLTRASHIVKIKDLIPLIKKSGCIGMEMGIESADPAAHKAVDKEESLEITMKAADILKFHGLYPMFTYMALNPGDTLNTYYNQAKFIDKILDGCGWIDYFHPLPIPLYIGQLCTPHPGTKLYDEAPELGIVNTTKWSDYYHHRVNFIPNTLLNDIPIKQTEKLSYREMLLCVKGMIASVYKFIEQNKSFVWRLSKISEYLEFIQLFYDKCNGNISVKKIAIKLNEKLNYSNDKLWNYTGITVVVLSQIGYIQSKNNKKKLPIRNIDISNLGNTMRLAKRLHIINIIKKYILFFCRKKDL